MKSPMERMLSEKKVEDESLESNILRIVRGYKRSKSDHFAAMRRISWKREQEDKEQQQYILDLSTENNMHFP